ncbi:MAG: hypothetical protein ACOZIN_19920 [Myxococcota bacterium]
MNAHLPLLALTLIAAAPAQARFGKRSPPNPAKEEPCRKDCEGKRKKVPAAASAPAVYATPRYHAHAATPVGSAPVRPRLHAHVLLGPSVHVTEPAAPSEPSGGAPVRLSLLGEAMVFGDGALLGAGLFFEGERVGLSASFSTLGVSADDGSGGVDGIGLLSAHLTYALLAGERGRLRLELGADSAIAPDLVVMGPTLGTSAVLWLGGPLAVEGALMVTPFPYRQVDARVGVGLGFGPLGLRGGYRTLVLDDAGLVDGVAHVDVFGGPYLGLALVF